MPKKKPNELFEMLTNTGIAVDTRLNLLRTVAKSDDENTIASLKMFIESSGSVDPEDEYVKKSKELQQLIAELMAGPCRNATFVNASFGNRALIVLDDGTFAYTAVSDRQLVDDLKTGDRIMVDGKCSMILGRGFSMEVGDVSTIQRWIDDKYIEVKDKKDDLAVMIASQVVLDKAAEGKAQPGASILVNPRQSVVFDVLPEEDGLSHYRYLLRSSPPDVNVDRDIGAPPRCIDQLSAVIRMELVNPEARRRYHLPRCTMKLLAGTSGSGKTLAIQALWRRMYEIMGDVTGACLDKLPPRVFRLRMSQVLSKWVGDSDRNLDRFFDEVEQMADEPFEHKGKQWNLPVLVIMEEIDGLARQRGQDPIHDRIMTVALQRLDNTLSSVRGRFLVFIGTTNEPHMLDRAFLRRIGGTVEYFTRLNDKGAFTAVFQKHIQRVPLFGRQPQENLQRKFINEVTGWFFNADNAVVELMFAGSQTPQVRHRRDFLTGALIDRAVQQAAEETCKAEILGVGEPGVTIQSVLRAFEDQVGSVVEQLNENNAREYTHIPEGARVSKVRRLQVATN